MNRILIILIALPVLFTACRPKEIDINVTPQDPKLVVFSHVIPDNVMLISLSKSFSALKPQEETSFEDLLVGGADVKVNVNGETISFYELEYGLYASLETPTGAGASYELTAIKGNDTVTAKSIMLEQVNFQSIVPVVTKTASDTTTSIKVKFNDITPKENWYIINVYKKNSAAEEGSVDGVNFFANGSNDLAKTVLISDNEIPGSYEETLLLDNVRHDDSIVVTLSNISEKYYNYLTLRQEGSGNIFTSLNLEPVNHPTNVENGYGFFNTHFPDVHFYDLGEY